MYFDIWAHLGRAGKPLKHPKMTTNGRVVSKGKMISFINNDSISLVFNTSSHPKLAANPNCNGVTRGVKNKFKDFGRAAFFYPR